jgi:hypothetical protein
MRSHHRATAAGAIRGCLAVCVTFQRLLGVGLALVSYRHDQLNVHRQRRALMN